MSYDQLRLASKFNPIWKQMAHTLTVKCNHCDHKRLESVFHAFTTGETPHWRSCWFTVYVFRPLIKYVFRARVENLWNTYVVK
jgi:hypothetical protein